MAFKAFFTKEWHFQDHDLDMVGSDTTLSRRSVIEIFGYVKKELSILSPLKHPHIIQLHGVIMRPLIGIILELAPLGSLKTILCDYAEACVSIHITVIKQVLIQVHLCLFSEV